MISSYSTNYEVLVLLFTYMHLDLDPLSVTGLCDMRLSIHISNTCLIHWGTLSIYHTHLLQGISSITVTYTQILKNYQDGWMRLKQGQVAYNAHTVQL